MDVPMLDVNSFALFPNLPEDIGRTIFEISVEDGNGTACARVSKQVQSWVTPMLYRRVFIPEDAQSRKFYLTMLTSTKSPDFFAQHVKVMVLNTWDTTLVYRFLLTCTNLKVLAYWRNEGGWLTSQDVAWKLVSSATAKLSRFSFSCRGRLHQLDFSLPILRNLSHLELKILNEGTPQDDWKWDTLRELTRLTHLSLGVFFPFDDDFARFLEKVPRFFPQDLRVFVAFVVFQGSDGQSPNLEMNRFDSRIVLAASEGSDSAFVDERVIHRSSDELARDWAGASDDADFWARAETMIANRGRPK